MKLTEAKWEEDELLMGACKRTIKKIADDAKDLFRLQDIQEPKQNLRDMVLFAKMVHGICVDAMPNTYGENQNAVRHLMNDAELFYENMEV